MRALMMLGSVLVATVIPAASEEPFAEYPPEFRTYLKALHDAGPGKLAFREGETPDV